jgi:hypothetical protein
MGFGGTGGGDTNPFGPSGRAVRKGLISGVEGGREGFAPALLLFTCPGCLESIGRVEAALSSALMRSGVNGACVIAFALVEIFKLAWRLGGGGSGPESVGFSFLRAILSSLLSAFAALGGGRCWDLVRGLV